MLLVSVYKGIHGQNRNVKVKIQADKYMRIHRTSNMQGAARNVVSAKKVIYCKVSDGLQRIQGSTRSANYVRFCPM
jgi:hypothetical protein